MVCWGNFRLTIGIFIKIVYSFVGASGPYNNSGQHRFGGGEGTRRRREGNDEEEEQEEEAAE